MRNGLTSPAPSIIRIHLQVLCNLHTPALRAADERLRAAMADYAASCAPSSGRGLAS